MSVKPRAIHFGAGNIGRGFIAPLLSRSGYHVVFTDVDKELIDTINEEKGYSVYILDTNGSDADNGEKEVQPIVHVKGVLSTTNDLIREIEHPKLKLITTAVGLPILDKIAPTLAKGLKARRAAGGGTINIIACENAIGATAQLAKKVHAHLEGEDAAWAEAHVGFANCSVDRIVPPFSPEDHDGADSVLDVGVEEFFEWVVEGPSLKGDANGGKGGALDVPIQGMTLTDNLAAYNERKLFTLNAGHAIAAYLGHLKGLRTVDASISDEEIAAVVRGALADEAGKALCQRHHFNEEEHKAYIEKIIGRFQNAAVKDDVVRVGRQPLRKLGREDRLVGPARMCAEAGIPVKHLATGIAAALWYENEEDEQSVEMRKAIADKGLEKYVVELTGFEEGSDVHKQILKSYAELKRCFKSDTQSNGDAASGGDVEARL
ncbi:mannitol-1-phosphate 5-dehydrogenase [Mycena albidolilacea]|uniref:Mannitol-1-phosphate 5-dehydrogenase n=1 Tax=Mycena albidolilacea TaxID=1033008 RepID=A0AAD7EE33_9AGAR|nr:mannitol-1-phosphate 5-dehydrogenase [Mycena albidolilacea]